VVDAEEPQLDDLADSSVSPAASSRRWRPLIGVATLALATLALAVPGRDAYKEAYMRFVKDNRHMLKFPGRDANIEKKFGLCNGAPEDVMCCNTCPQACQDDIFSCNSTDFENFVQLAVDKELNIPGINSFTESFGFTCPTCSTECLAELVDCSSTDWSTVKSDYIHHLFPCFPGQSLVHVEGLGASRIMDLNVHDRVLVQSAHSDSLMYEPVLGFLHAVAGGGSASSSFLNIVYSTGVLRVSENHIVFVTGAGARDTDKIAVNVVPGDELVTVSSNGSATTSSRVLVVTREVGELGMYAPLTAAGRIVVDGVVSSTYATHGHLQIPHCALHATFFLTRAYHQSGLALLLAPVWTAVCDAERNFWLCQGGGKPRLGTGLEEKSPLATILHDMLRFDKFLDAIQ
jgi:hypothetical protein